jgi:hypothetical protein
MRRRDAWAYGLVGLNVAVVLLWWPVSITGVDALAPFTNGLWRLLPPAVLVLLGGLGFWMWGRVWLSAQAHHRTPRSLVALAWSSALVLMPLGFYALLTLYTVTFPEF